jgi:hypothetical protein
VKTSKGQKVGAHSLAHNTLGVEGHAGALGWGLGRVISGVPKFPKLGLS